MHVATSCGRLDLAKSLYEEYGINLEAKNGLGITPLWLACRYAHADFVYWLVQEGVKIEPILESYHSPLMFVLNFAKHEYEAISKALCKAGADLKSLIFVDQSYACIDMLSWAALYSNTNVVRAFLNLSPTEASCDAAMTWAAYVCHLDIFQLINEYRSSQFKVTPTPTENHIYLGLAVNLPIYARTWSYNSQFHEMIVHLIDQMEDVPTSLLSQWASGAVTGNDIESMRTLLDQPKATSIVERRYDSKGEGVRGLLETTIIMDKKDIFDLLISRGFSVQQHSINNLFSTLFHSIALRELKHSLHFCQIVYEHGEDVNKLSGPEHSDCSAQMVAVSAGNLPVLDFLLHHGANMNGDNEWVLEELISKRSARVLPVLDFVLNHPCGPPNFTTDPSRKTNALHLAAGPRFSPQDRWQNHESLIAGPAAVLGYLLKQFSDPNLHLNAKDIAGNTALHVAAYSGCDWAVKLLLNAGADPYACNDQGLNPYDCTISKRNLGRRLSTAVSFEDFDPGVTEYAVASVKGRRHILSFENKSRNELEHTHNDEIVKVSGPSDHPYSADWDGGYDDTDDGSPPS
ncbi:hypothetical protein JMJ35_009997 [Cladonia borealis]|uniref:Ankyrin n=1 Tax=Cladonia borealis TaxID=184061 RepID=A0AA39QS82_9LECA|nr:hypothetical protein JMJ35_009997 [Cladonia borealis]